MRRDYFSSLLGSIADDKLAILKSDAGGEVLADVTTVQAGMTNVSSKSGGNEASALNPISKTIDDSAYRGGVSIDEYLAGDGGFSWTLEVAKVIDRNMRKAYLQKLTVEDELNQKDAETVYKVMILKLAAAMCEEYGSSRALMLSDSYTSDIPPYDLANMRYLAGQALADAYIETKITPAFLKKQNGNRE